MVSRPVAGAERASTLVRVLGKSAKGARIPCRDPYMVMLHMVMLQDQAFGFAEESLHPGTPFPGTLFRWLPRAESTANRHHLNPV